MTATTLKGKGPLVALSLVLALVLAACGGADDTSTTDERGGDSGQRDADSDADTEVTEGLTDETLVPVIRLVGPSTAYELEQYEANRLTLDNWEALGLRTEYETTPDWAGFTGAVADFDWHAASAGYLGTPFRIDPDELLSRPLLCALGDGGSNYGDYCSDEYDDAVMQQKREFDQDRRRELVIRAQEIQALDLPYYVMFYPADAYIWNQEAYTDVVPAVGQGLDNFWNEIGARPAGNDRTYRLGIQGTFRSINPMGAGDYNNDVAIHNLVYDTLLKTGPEGDTVNWAAESWEAIDETTIEAVLRDDLFFHDGEPVTAEDVAFSYQYIKDWEVGLYVNFLAPLESAEAVDDRTVRFHLSEPTATFASVTMATIVILPAHIWDGLVEREGLDHPNQWTETQMIGSGPYKVRSVSPAEGVELDRNDDHFNPPASESFQSRYFADGQGLFRAMQSGAVYFHQTGRLGASPMEEAERDSKLGAETRPGITVRWMALSFREDSPFRDYHFRNALAHAVDYETIVDAILRGFGDPGAGTIGAGNDFWKADLPREESDGPYWRPFDMGRARQLLAEAGYRWDAQGRLHFPENYEPQVHYNS
jgi:peptide/nickel transport system substrate-binding protein